MAKRVTHYVPGTNITFTMKPGSVHIDNDSYLRTVLNNEVMTAKEIAREIKDIYYDVYGENLDISTKSLAIEILGHVYPGEFAKFIKKEFDLPNWITKQIDKVVRRTEVIDCGEDNKGSEDDNRAFWDFLAKLFDTLSSVVTVPFPGL
ncbi:hypothetical protein ABE237_02170 [Brevibacillus formosus]|uniref:hypothetical protein n=1 Tax=Brevibacillus TaxID=55080 RepID=UPI000D0FCFF8|nr:MULTISPECIES: hypothetical protein [Brevibacillus]MBG9942761.1 hypothetical protein [Brevibacillus formosus]MED1945135.1 hypothetical protein [Brevibacillus formosus]MED1996178.1 hypothetical protein [Brevibacillus formosus]MED2081147.1 hypothetical protein [Brevibacillus formosus]PSK14401.1 hypothetical protein C7R94_21915 [Brevibacillus sp. NRRL NRS-603]